MGSWGGEHASVESVSSSRQVVARGSWLSSADTSTAYAHETGCLYYIKGAEEVSKRWAVAFTGLQGLINHAIEVSFKYSTGAGGFSLSPNFTYYPSIDRRRDPAFRIIGLVRWAYPTSYMGRAYLPKTCDLLELCMENIALLYRRSKASPKAVNCMDAACCTMLVLWE